MQIQCDFPRVPVIFLFLFTRAVIPVTVVVSPPTVVDQLPLSSLLINCTFCPDSRNRSYHLFWNRVSHGNITLVIRRLSSGKVISGQGYKGRAHIRDGCALQIDNPTVEDSGRYAIRVVVPGDQKEEDSQTVNISVTPVKPATLVSLKTTSSKTEKIQNVTEKDPSETISEHDQYRTDWQTSVIMGCVMGVLLTMLIALTILVIRYALRNYRHDGRNSPTLNSLLEKDSRTDRKRHSLSQTEIQGANKMICKSETEKLTDDIPAEIPFKVSQHQMLCQR